MAVNYSRPMTVQAPQNQKAPPVAPPAAPHARPATRAWPAIQSPEQLRAISPSGGLLKRGVNQELAAQERQGGFLASTRGNSRDDRRFNTYLSQIMEGLAPAQARVSKNGELVQSGQPIHDPRAGNYQLAPHTAQQFFTGTPWAQGLSAMQAKPTTFGNGEMDRWRSDYQAWLGNAANQFKLWQQNTPDWQAQVQSWWQQQQDYDRRAQMMKRQPGSPGLLQQGSVAPPAAERYGPNQYNPNQYKAPAAERYGPNQYNPNQYKAPGLQPLQAPGGQAVPFNLTTPTDAERQAHAIQAAALQADPWRKAMVEQMAAQRAALLAAGSREV